MKKITKIYDSSKIAIRISFFGFLLVAFGFLIKNDSVNIFYTFKNAFILLMAEGALKLGTTIIANLPMIFMLNIVCKRANSGYPVVLAIVGYFAFLISTMLFSPTTLTSTAYSTGLGINSIFNVSNSGTKYPLETGLIGSFIVGYITRISYIRSRHRNTYSILGFLNKDSAGIIYNVVFCGLAGIAIAYLWPIAFNYLQTLIAYISKDLLDPLRIALYGVLDRILSILSLGNIIRQPFWYTALGGSLQTISGQSIMGDVNIWNYVKNIANDYVGAGRFITPYYVINMFMTPAILLGMLASFSDKQERKKFILPFIAGCLMSIVCGNPLPTELVLLFTSPLLLFIYIVFVGLVFYFLSFFGIYLGSSIIPGSVVTAMPGNFPDYIINLRNVNYISSLGKIALVGVIVFILMFAIATLYYRFFAYDLARTGKAKDFASRVVKACGGSANISFAGSGLFKVCVHLNDLEKYDLEQLKALEVRQLNETKDGIEIECGASAFIIANRINRIIKAANK